MNSPPELASAPLFPTEVHDRLASVSDKLTQEEILKRWPTDDPPDRSTLTRWLKRAVQQGIICCSGIGYRGDPFRYWLPGHEPLLWPGKDASETEKEAWRQRWAAYQRGENDPAAEKGTGSSGPAE